METMKKVILNWAKRNLILLKIVGIILNVCTFLLLLLWVLKMKVDALKDFDFEAILACVSPLALSLNQLHRKLLEQNEYSPAVVLAHGYVYNFLLPVITQLKEDGVVKPKICLYKTYDIDDLTDKKIDLMKADLINKSFQLLEVKLNLKQARARDILTISKGSNQTYFDFPNTLLSLFNYIDYKLETKSNRHSDKQKKDLAEKLISEFYETLDDLLTKNRIKQYIKYCDFNFKIFG